MEKKRKVTRYVFGVSRTWKKKKILRQAISKFKPIMSNWCINLRCLRSCVVFFCYSMQFFFFFFGCLNLKSQLVNSILMLRFSGQSLHQGHGRRIEGLLPHESIAKLCKSCFENSSNVSFGEVTNRRKQFILHKIL